MEVAVIDWKNIDSRFDIDDLYEHINAPKWVDLLSTDDDTVDDEAWFCRPSCNHPKTVDDFLKEKKKTPLSNSKHHRSASVSDIPPRGDRNKREATLKKRGVNQPTMLSDAKYNVVLEDGENQDPNYSTPPVARSLKDAIKSSSENKQNSSTKRKEQMRKLKSTLSSRNLFSGGDLLNKVAEFCTELKKLATGSRDKEQKDDVISKMEEKREGNGDAYGNFGYLNDKEKERKPLLEEKLEGNGDAYGKLGYLNDKEKERKPLLEMSKGKSEVMGTSGLKGKPRRKKINDDAENTPISVDVKNIKRKEGEIRTYPPTPQGFSGSGGHLKPTPPKPFKSRLQERGILQELDLVNKEESSNHNRGGEMAEKEARTLDVFWFLKPCTLSS